MAIDGDSKKDFIKNFQLSSFIRIWEINGSISNEGIETARLNGKQIGQRKGVTYETQKAKAAKDIIRRHNKSFGGSLTDHETMRQAGISRKSFYKYKWELRSIDADDS